MSDDCVVADDEDSASDDPYAGPSPYDNETEISRAIARLRAQSPGQRRTKSGQPERNMFERMAAMKRATERRRRNAISIPDSDPLDADDIDIFRRGGARFFPWSAFEGHRVTGLVVLVERHLPSIVFLTPDDRPVRASLPYDSAHQFVGRIRAALGDDERCTVGPPIDDPRWRGIGVAYDDGAVRLRLHTDEFDRTVTLQPDDARRLADSLAHIVRTGPR